MNRVLLINWDNYPNIASGGVYAWAKSLVESLTDFEFIVLDFISNPNVNARYKLPANVIDVIECPLYGSLRPEEFMAGRHTRSLDRILLNFANTTSPVIEKEFRPLFESFVQGLTTVNADSQTIMDSLVKLHKFFQTHDLKSCIESAITFNAFVEVLRTDPVFSGVTVSEAASLFSFLQRILLVISIDLPKVDVIHSSNAWFPAFAGLCLKVRYDIPLVVTEHGLAFKDLLLYQRLFSSTKSYSSLWKTVLTNIIRTTYDRSDLVTSVCEANTKITDMLGTSAKARVCYNGVDNNKFKPLETGRDKTRPTIVFVGRIELLKDVLNLIEAVSYVKEAVPNVMCKIYGTSTDINYAKECMNLVAALRLEETVEFMGSTSAPQAAYNAGDIVVLSSVREGFPYTVIEAMSCGKPVVATNVGGVSEALRDSGFLVKSRHPLELSNAIVRVLKDPELGESLGQQGNRVVQELFTLGKSTQQWRGIYLEMLARGADSQLASVNLK